MEAKYRWPVHADDEVEAVVRVLRSGKTNYWTGDEGQSFEKEFAIYTGAAHALAVSNGTTALEVALHVLDLSPWDEVIVPCRTFMATASAVVTAGGSPVLADIDSMSLNVTVDTLEARRTQFTVAVIVVHYAGWPCDMPAICEWAEKWRIAVIEDCAHAHGARIDGQHVGTFGIIGCFSFCVGKIMSTGGEGGMVITNFDDLHKGMAARRDHGRYQMVGSRDFTDFKYTVEEFGTNLRMTEMQAALGRRQLLKLDEWIFRRREIALMYDAVLDMRNINRHAGHVFYMYLIEVGAKRDGILRILNAAGYPARIGGCQNIGLEPVFRRYTEKWACPVADEVSVLALPIYPTMSNADVLEVANATKQAIASI